MTPRHQKMLMEAAPLLFAAAAGSPWRVAVPDDLYPFLHELVEAVEKFNRRYRKRVVRVMKITMNEGELEFVLNRTVPILEKRIAAARQQIKLHRRVVRSGFLARAKAMGTTALFASSLISEWKRLMPDERETLRKILRYAERFAATPADYGMLAEWYGKLLNDNENRSRFQKLSKGEVP